MVDNCSTRLPKATKAKAMNATRARKKITVNAKISVDAVYKVWFNLFILGLVRKNFSSRRKITSTLIDESLTYKLLLPAMSAMYCKYSLNVRSWSYVCVVVKKMANRIMEVIEITIEATSSTLNKSSVKWLSRVVMIAGMVLALAFCFSSRISLISPHRYPNTCRAYNAPSPITSPSEAVCGWGSLIVEWLTLGSTEPAPFTEKV
mmetsp:Transcript_58082/g.127305  ORF Transcript_58082/g.127305 Transcript_58082/m.127305 type:complete len:205 (+) Transcript_58082:1275-1889(+)